MLVQTIPGQSILRNCSYLVSALEILKSLGLNFILHLFKRMVALLVFGLLILNSDFADLKVMKFAWDLMLYSSVESR